MTTEPIESFTLEQIGILKKASQYKMDFTNKSFVAAYKEFCRATNWQDTRTGMFKYYVSVYGGNHKKRYLNTINREDRIGAIQTTMYKPHNDWVKTTVPIDTFIESFRKTKMGDNYVG